VRIFLEHQRPAVFGKDASFYGELGGGRRWRVPRISAALQPPLERSRRLDEGLDGGRFLAEDEGHRDVFIDLGFALGPRHPKDEVMVAQLDPRELIRNDAGGERHALKAGAPVVRHLQAGAGEFADADFEIPEGDPFGGRELGDRRRSQWRGRPERSVNRDGRHSCHR
jgi:hypothetical protein